MFPSLTMMAAALVATATPVAAQANEKEINCVALAIYFEARGEPAKGQQAVGNVIMNRTKSGKYPTTPCGVLYQRSQFGFVRGRSVVPAPTGSSQWPSILDLAKRIFEGAADVTNGALYFSTSGPRSGMRIGHHIFH